MNIDAAVEKAAEAVFAKHAVGQGYSPDLREHDSHTQRYWEDHVRAVFDALGLTEETRTLEDGYGGVITNYATGEVTFSNRPCTRQQRLVTPWETT